jgi:hypothetical protein
VWICAACHEFVSGKRAEDPALHPVAEPAPAIRYDSFRLHEWRPPRRPWFSRRRYGAYSPLLVRRAEARAISQTAVLWMFVADGVLTWLWPDFPRWLLSILEAAAQQ